MKITGQIAAAQARLEALGAQPSVVVVGEQVWADLKKEVVGCRVAYAHGLHLPEDVLKELNAPIREIRVRGVRVIPSADVEEWSVHVGALAKQP